MISPIHLPHHRSEADPQKQAKTRELIAGIALIAILMFQIGLIVWVLFKDWHLQ